MNFSLKNCQEQYYDSCCTMKGEKMCVAKIGGTEGIAYSLLHTFVKFNSWICHQGESSGEKLP